MTSVELRCGPHTVGRYVHRPDLPTELSPRPYYHPLITLGGTPVTKLSPPDHRHHLGAGFAVPDVGGYNFWGGRTFVRGQGPTRLDNHGTQRHERWSRQEATVFGEDLGRTAGGRRLLTEQRMVSIGYLSPTAWRLDIAFTLTNTTDRPLPIASPAANGRPGAGYGGFFWRAPRACTEPLLFTADAQGEEQVHGKRADWLAMAGDGWTLVFTGPDPWFVRGRAYPGVGQALAWHALVLPPGGSVVRRVATAIADGRLRREEAAALTRAADRQPPPHPWTPPFRRKDTHRKQFRQPKEPPCHSQTHHDLTGHHCAYRSGHHG